MSDKPKISMIIPVYNVEEYLRECLDSIVNQTLKEIEIICINDGSTDNSLQILNEYAKKDSRFIVITQENQGQGVARNKGIDMAKGETIMFVDPDDFIDLNTCEVLYNKYEEADVDIIHFDYEIYRKESGKPNRICSIQKDYKKKYNFVLKNNQIYLFKDIKKVKFESAGLAVWNRFYSTKFVKQNNIKFAPNKYTEDNIFSLKILLLANKFLYINTPFYHYRERVGSSVNKASNDNFCVLDNIQLFKNFLQEYSLFEKYEREYYQYIISVFADSYDCIPTESIDRYLQNCKEVLGEKNYEKFVKSTKDKYSLMENIFSIKNRKNNGKKTKYIRILGFDLVVRQNK